MESIGDKLREARARQGTDLGDVEAKTKIRSRYLRALENEDFHLLPGHAYARSFLRTYADLLGLDSQELVQEYRYQVEGEPRPGAPAPQIAEQEAPGAAVREYPPLDYDGPPQREVPALPDGEFADTESRQPRTLRSDMAAAAGSLALLRRRLGSRAALVAGAAVALIVLAIVVVAIVSPGGKSGQQAAKVGPPPPAPTPAPPPAPPQQLTMTIAPAGRTYICVDTGPNTNTQFQGIIFSPMTFTGTDLRITLGKRDGNLQLNGRPVPLGNDNTPLGLEFTQTGQRQLTPEERPCPAPTSSATATQTNVSSTNSGSQAPGTPNTNRRGP